MDTQNLTEDQITLDLISSLISEYVDRDNRSLRMLSDKSKIARPYVTQLYRKEIPVDKIKPVKLFKVLERVDRDKAFEIVMRKEAWHEEIIALIGFDKSFLKRLVKPEDSDVEDIILQDDFTITAFILSLNNNGIFDGVTKEDLKEIGGGVLLNAAKRLEELGILIFNGNAYVPIMFKDGKTLYSFSRTHLGKVIAATVSRYNPSHAGQQRNHRSLTTGSVSVGCIREIIKKTDEYRRDISSLIKDPENKGNNPMFLNITVDTYKDDLDHGDRLQ